MTRGKSAAMWMWSLHFPQLFSSSTFALSLFLLNFLSKYKVKFNPFDFLNTIFMDPTYTTGLTRENSSSSSAHNACPSMAWTDEKHRLYLDSLEADFVKKLHHSIELRQGVSGHCFSHPTNHFTSASKKNFQSSQEFEHSATSFASSLEQKRSMHLYDWHHGSVGSNIEVSDQNFVDENVEEKPKGKSRVKRSKSDWRL